MIEIEHLTKRYGEHTAVSDLSLRIGSGQIYGFLGPNGAGKSTTMNILTGCLSATEGSVRIDGFDIFEEPKKAKKRIGYLPEQPPLYMNENPVEYLQFVGEAKGLRGAELRRQIGEVLEQTGVAPVRNKRIAALSKGYKQRVGIAQALLGNPEVIVLDEPTVGLDPLQIIEIRTLIKELGKTHTVLFSSHILSEVQNLCDQILIIAKGKLVAFDTPENLETRLRGQSEIRLTTDASCEEAEKILSGLADIGQAAYSPGEGGLLCVRIQTGAQDVYAASRRLFFAFAQEQKALCELVVKRASLEDVFLELTESAGEPPAEETGPQSAQPEEKEEAKNP
ncbi:MAG TPA: ABC transporter ATP-binding protein [Candidatus Spyradocola merdavium]|nr:ABC transporter ATP-binding protein [Candidatus Spyradocola merdavium]